MVMSFLGGSMFPIYAMPPALQAVSKITLNNWALRGCLSLMLNNGIGSIVTPLIILCAMGAAFLGAGILRLKFE
jgi:ABC-type multidrug transport system permease subunit